MKVAVFLIVMVVGIALLLVIIAMSGMQREFGASANTTATEVLGANYTQFGGMPEIFAFWWIVPILVFACLIFYSLYKVYKH